MTQQRSAPPLARPLPVAAFGTLLALAAFTFPLATIGSTAATLGSDASGRTWILSSMSIGLSAALLVSGALADDIGRRRTFVLGLVVLALASAVCAAAPSTLVFVLARVVQGVGAGAVLASSLGVIAHAFEPGPLRARASGIWGAAVGAGITLGPLLSATSDRLATWREGYWLLTALTLVAVVVAGRLLAESRTETPRGLDLIGAVALSGGLSALLAALVEGRAGWTRPLPLVLLAVAALLLAGFVLHERRTASPMLDLTLLRQPAFLAATVAALATGAGVIALMSYMAGFVGAAFGLDALHSAFLLFGWSATSVITALLARRIPASVSGRTQLALGLVGVAVGTGLLLGLSETSSPLRLVPGLVLAGAATGIVNAALGREAVASVPAGRAAMGSGANNTARYLGSAIGVTVVSVVVLSAGTAPSAVFDGWNHAVIVVIAITALGAAVVAATRPRAAR
ncbi:MFS transporter [Rhodococcus sp. NBC_00294]|uniref:MFS transporter n=1 Tax=Rhodococcus sp. NBC_00294 TaxID=2976004 RepID=UPI002E2C8D67|nr:MFS transporter [Rhodococcus sp. NBC_00294]